MFKFNSKALFFIALLLMLCFMPETSWAAEGSIFDIISAKMIETVKDVRRIVYIVAGFGLIMFAVLAIFNKISFKHLSYICIGLFLLAVMMPFINYFSGAKLTDPELNYGMLIDPDNPDIVGSNVKDGERREYPQLENLSDLEKNIREKYGDAAAQQGLPGLDFGKDLSETEPCDGFRVKTTSGKLKCCKNGPNNKGTGCKVSLGDIVKAGKAAVGAAQSAVKAAGNVKNAVEGAVKGVGGVWDAAKSGRNILDSVEHLAKGLGNTAGQVGTSFNNAVNAAQDLTEDLGDASRRLNGGNSKFADKVDNEDSKFNQWAEKAKEKTQKDRKFLNEKVVEPGQDIGDIDDHLNGLKNSLNNFFK